MAETVSFKRRGESVDHVSLTVNGGESKDFKLTAGVLKTSDPGVIAALRADVEWDEQTSKAKE